MSGRRIAVLDIGGTKIKGCVFTDGNPGEKRETDSEAKKGAACLLERAFALLEEFRPFEAIGISTAGQVDPATGTIRYANDNVPGYTGTDVKGCFEKRFGVPTTVVNDVYAAALGEGIAGAASGERDYLCLTYGTGIGGGVVLDGKLYYGAGASAGVMLGGLILHPEKLDPADPFAGTYERCASTTALCAAMDRVIPGMTGRDIFQRLEEPSVKDVVDAWLEEVAAGLCALIHAYNVPCVVLGGGVMEQPYAIEQAVRGVQKHLIPGFRGVRIVGASLGNMAGLYGAHSLAANNFS